MKNSTGKTNFNEKEIYLNFLDNMREQAEDEFERIADKIADETDSVKILELQKEFKRARRKWGVICRMHDGIRPFSMQEIVSSIAEPEVLQEIMPVLDTVNALRDALGMTGND